MTGPAPLGPERKASRQEIGKNKIGPFQRPSRLGSFAGPHLALHRLGRPEELAGAVVLLASDRETRYVSGGPRVSNRED